MKPYQPSKYAELVFSVFSSKYRNVIFPVLFALICVSLLISNIMAAVFGAIFILLIFNMFLVNAIENPRIKKYCKDNGITVDEFNILNK